MYVYINLYYLAFVYIQIFEVYEYTIQVFFAMGREGGLYGI